MYITVPVAESGGRRIEVHEEFAWEQIARCVSSGESLVWLTTDPPADSSGGEGMTPPTKTPVPPVASQRREFALVQGYAWLVGVRQDGRNTPATRDDLVSAAEFLEVRVGARDTVGQLLQKTKNAVWDRAAALGWSFKATCTRCRAEFALERRHLDGVSCPRCGGACLLTELVEPGVKALALPDHGPAAGATGTPAPIRPDQS